jgi:hypothetical protein
MTRGRRSVLALGFAALTSGCVPEIDREHPVVMDVLMLVVGATGRSVTGVAVPQAKTKLTSELTVPATVTIGGLSGTYDVTLGSHGQFTGTAEIKGQKGAKLTDDGSPGLLAAVHGIVLDGLATDVTVTEAKATIKGKQTTGGVQKNYKGKIKFKGTVASGPDTGATVKGKISAKGDLAA